MTQSLLMLAEDSAIFNLRNGILVLVLVAIIVVYKVVKNKQS